MQINGHRLDSRAISAQARAKTRRATSRHVGTGRDPADRFHMTARLTCPDSVATIAFMTTFAERLSVGDAHQSRVADELEARGYAVTAWGQAILPEVTRRTIREVWSRFRYFPDLIASRSGEIVTIDAKDCMHSNETGRYAISQACTSFGLQFTAAFGLPLYYVVGNLAVLCPTEVMSYGQIGPRATGGAYYLVDSRFARNFDDVFGSPLQAVA
jgi:hypothetical protein